MQHLVEKDRRACPSIFRAKSLTFVLQYEKEKTFNPGTKVRNFRVIEPGAQSKFHCQDYWQAQVRGFTRDQAQQL